MYTGFRALVNRARSIRHVLDANIASLHGVEVTAGKLGELVFYVHPRPCPGTAADGRKHGVFSIRQQQPTVGRLLYRYFCRTSHFGCGHIEIAFYERGGEVTFYGVRNIARANACRLGLSSLSHRLQLAKRDEDVMVLRAASGILQSRGFSTRHAQADECMQLTVDDRLLHAGTHAEARISLHRKYAKLHTIFENRLA